MKDFTQGIMHSTNSNVDGRYRGEKTRQQLENEVKLLREKLSSAQHTLSEMGHQMDLQKTRTRQLLAGWKIKLEESEDKVMTQAEEKDRQFTELISDLMYFEGCLKKERQDIITQMGDKDRRIRELERLVLKQERQINALNKANEKLLSSLHDNRESGGATSSDTSHQDETSGHDTSSEAEINSGVASSPLVASRRQNGRRFTVHSDPSHSSPISSAVKHKNNNTIKSVGSTNGHQHRVRFMDEVMDDLSSSGGKRGFLKVEDRTMARKISLPAYCLPGTNEGEERVRYF